jgi:tetratricopeptide (TPR) repeat protein
MWKPPRSFSSQDESHHPSDREAIDIACSKLQQAYLSKNCLKRLRLPEGLAMLETTLFIVCEHAVKGYTLVQSGAHIRNKELDAASDMEKWCFSVKCGSMNLLNHNVSQAFASFEFASRLLKRCMSETNSHLFSKVLVALAYAQSRKAHDVVQLFLKQIAALATTSLGPRHPISIWARNILVMGVNVALVEKLYVAEMSAACNAGFLDRYGYEVGVFGLKCDVRGADYHLLEAEGIYQNLVDRNLIEGPPKWRRYTFQFLSVNMAQLYLEHESFSKAVSVLSDAHTDLEEYVSKGWAPSMPLTAPLSAIMIVWRLYLLGQALAGQGDHESANTAFESAISAGLKYLDHDHHVSISAQKAYSEYLSSQNLKEEADEIERIVDLKLDMYKLSVSNDG